MDTDFHDWSLLSIITNMYLREITIKLRGQNNKIKIIKIKSCNSINIPMINPWGPSEQINKTIIGNLENHLKFIIEMQSGDLIEIITDGYECIKYENEES